METLLWIKVNRSMADAMRADRLSGEELIRTWMRGWKMHTGSNAVTVTVEWRSTTIAVGETTLLAGDQVRFR